MPQAVSVGQIMCAKCCCVQLACLSLLMTDAWPSAVDCGTTREILANSAKLAGDLLLWQSCKPAYTPGGGLHTHAPFLIGQQSFAVILSHYA